MRHNRIKPVTKRIWIGGEFYGRENCPVAYRPIHKNAHSWGKKYFKLIADFEPIENFANKKYIVFVRNPVDRWFSGMVEWFVQNTTENLNYTLDNVTLALAFATPANFDSHTAPQYFFLEGIEKSDCYFFDINDINFVRKLDSFMSPYTLYKPSEILEKQNVSAGQNYKMHIYNQLKNAYNTNAKFKKMLDDRLQEEVHWYNNIHKR